MPKKRQTRKGYLKRRKTRGRKQRAGAEVGEGSYGCVYTPSLPCGNSTNDRANAFKGQSLPNYVTKLTDARTATEEKEKGNQLRIALETTALAPNNILLGPAAICGVPPDLTDVQKAEIAKCPIKIPDPYLVQLKHGGISLDKFRCPVEDRGQFMYSIFQLLQGLSILHSRNIAHLDIKPQNIVTMRRDDGTYFTRFIDIGFMMNIDEYDEADLSLGSFKTNYVIWPFEARYLAEPIVDPLPYEIVDFYDECVNKLPQYGIPNMLYFINNNPAEGRIFENAAFITNYKKFFRDAAGDRKIDVIAKGVDVYSMGYTLAHIYRKVFNQMYVNGKGVLMLAQDAFNMRLLNDVTQPMIVLIANMMHPFPEKRYSIEQATDEFNRILGKLNLVLGM